MARKPDHPSAFFCFHTLRGQLPNYSLEVRFGIRPFYYLLLSYVVSRVYKRRTTRARQSLWELPTNISDWLLGSCRACWMGYRKRWQLPFVRIRSRVFSCERTLVFLSVKRNTPSRWLGRRNVWFFPEKTKRHFFELLSTLTEHDWLTRNKSVYN